MDGLMPDPTRPPIDQAWPPQQYTPPPLLPPPPLPPAPAARRRWPTFIGGVAIGAAIAAAITAALMAGTRDTATRTPVTITATATPPPAPETPAPLPAADANRHTCNTWLSAGKLINDAATELSVLPSGVKILDPSVRSNPGWTAAVQKAAKLYGQAADTLAGDIAPGTTKILDETSGATAAALRVLSTGYATFDDAAGNTYHMMKESADTMDALCNRLAPR